MSDADPRIAADTRQGAAMEFGASIFFTNYPITPLDLPLTRRTAGYARACNWRRVGKRLGMPLFRRGCRSAHHPTPPLLDLAREVCVTASRPTHRRAPRAETRRSQISYAAANHWLGSTQSVRLRSIRPSILPANSAHATMHSANRANIASCQPGKFDRMTAEQLRQYLTEKLARPLRYRRSFRPAQYRHLRIRHLASYPAVLL